MDTSNSDLPAARDAAGRFLPGRSGNPAGKKPGTRNRATEIRAMLAEGDEMAVARTVIDKATSGDAVAARFLLGLLCPRPRSRGRAITLTLPDGARAGDTVAAFNATLQAMAAGEIATGLLFLDPDSADLHAYLNTVETPFNALGERELCPGSAALERVNAALR